MGKRVMALVVLRALARIGAAQTVDQAKLREAIKLPQVNWNFQFQYGTGGETRSGPRSEQQKRMAGSVWSLCQHQQTQGTCGGAGKSNQNRRHAQSVMEILGGS